MNKPPAGDLTIRLTPGDARTTLSAGVQYARALAGVPADAFLAALDEQEGKIARWVIDAGFDARQARATGREFKAAARAEWDRIAAAGGASRGRA